MSVEMVHVHRGDMVESIHRGDLVVVDSKGEILHSLGNPQKKTFWRSAAKPFQVLPFVREGGLERYGIEGHELALMCSSHGGEPEHTEAAAALLKKIGLDFGALDCGPARPMFERAYRDLLKAGEAIGPEHNPCSGKHSAMLALIQLKGFGLKDYIKKDHPVQQLIVLAVAKAAGLEPEDLEIAVDGCGVPVYGLSIYNMAIAYSALSGAGKDPAMRTVAEAMTVHPFYVAGTRRLDTILMEETSGRLIAKLGAESVYCVGLAGEGKSMVLKIEDGGYRALNPLVPAMLERYGFISADERRRVENRLPLDILNHRKETIGHYEVVC